MKTVRFSIHLAQEQKKLHKLIYLTVNVSFFHRTTHGQIQINLGPYAHFPYAILSA